MGRINRTWRLVRCEDDEKEVELSRSLGSPYRWKLIVIIKRMRAENMLEGQD